MASYGKSRMILVIVLGVFLSFFLLGTFNRRQIPPDHNHLQNSPISGRIHINGDMAWIDAKLAGLVTGNGVPNDPFVIENLIIDAEGSDSGILIENSFVYVRIENCTIYNADIGISIFNSYYNLILGNKVYDNDFGVRISDSERIIIMENQAYDNRYYGISLVSSSESDVIRNTARHNSYAGIHLNKASGVNVSENTVSHNNYFDWSMGIALTSCNTTVVANNELSHNRQSGINLNDCINNTIRFNIINQCDIGIYLAYSYDNDISNNYFKGNAANIVKFIEADSLMGVLAIIPVVIGIVAILGMLVVKK